MSHWKGLRNSERSKCSDKSIQRNKLIDWKQALRDLIFKFPQSIPQSLVCALTMQAQTDLIEQLLKTLKGILSNISSVLAHVNFKYHFSCNLLISFTYQDSLVILAYLCCWCCHREHTWVKDYVWLHWLGTVCYFLPFY